MAQVHNVVMGAVLCATQKASVCEAILFYYHVILLPTDDKNTDDSIYDMFTLV